MTKRGFLTLFLRQKRFTLDDFGREAAETTEGEALHDEQTGKALKKTESLGASSSETSRKAGQEPPSSGRAWFDPEYFDVEDGKWKKIKRRTSPPRKILLAFLILILVAGASVYAYLKLASSGGVHAPSAFSATVGNIQITLSWNNKNDADQVLIRCKTTGYPSSVTDGTLTYNGTGTSYIHENLEYGKTYYYGIWSVKIVKGEWKYSDRGAFASGTPYWLAPSNFAANVGNQQNILSWNKGNSADQVLIEYNTTGYPTSVTDGVLVYRGDATSHNHTGLEYDKAYYYVIWSARLIGGEWKYSNDSASASATPYWRGPDGETIQEYVETDGARSVGADGNAIVLFNNPEAHNPTWQELKQLLWGDKTDQCLYSETSFVCADFAEMLHNNAEKAEIRAAYVCIDLASYSEGHALNAFNTTDQGLVYIDDTGLDYSHTFSADKTVTVSEGSEYQPKSIFDSTQWQDMGTVAKIWIQW